MHHEHFSLMNCLDEIEDPRAVSNGTLYDFREILVIAICASLANGHHQLYGFRPISVLSRHHIFWSIVFNDVNGDRHIFRE